MTADLADQSIVDQNRIAAGAKVDGQAIHVASASRIARTV